MSLHIQSVSPAFITGQEMFGAFQRGERMTILDSHYAKTENSAWEAYVGQHIPGSMFCNPLTQLAAIPSREKGRNPLPEPDRLQRFFNDWGIMQDKPVYIYDAGSNLYAARAWWVFRWAGVGDVRILNGGTRQWEIAGGDVAGGIGALRGRGDANVSPGSMPELFIDQVDDWKQHNILVDARDEQRFAGRTEPFDHQAGHIPGSVNIPVDMLKQADGRMADPETVRETLAEFGVTSGEQVAVYSGSGLHSSLFIAAMEHAGLHGAKNFVGGWSQWAASRTRPIERD
ncbi:MAG TPA: sulfurtransferase [Candidatus Corynebacterium gallistercoris]|uniref:thiosulfate sulfurtransferase n=1 Tax=Candidatus Corynebacterium gallistercoris TaxID=2838530 RepID=A0A9D1UQC4_9CORY|nr:sulfurtransferase [Candidatus Corynebacterium gallistercoris]